MYVNPVRFVTYVDKVDPESIFFEPFLSMRVAKNGQQSDPRVEHSRETLGNIPSMDWRLSDRGRDSRARLPASDRRQPINDDYRVWNAWRERVERAALGKAI